MDRLHDVDADGLVDGQVADRDGGFVELVLGWVGSWMLDVAPVPLVIVSHREPPTDRRD